VPIDPIQRRLWAEPADVRRIERSQRKVPVTALFAMIYLQISEMFGCP
jgi:hypothetical protein